MTKIKLFGGDFGDDIMILECDLTRAESGVFWHAGDGEWQTSQYQCADCGHSDEGLFKVGKQIAAVALELPSVECEWVRL